MCNNVESVSFAGVKILIFINCLFLYFYFRHVCVFKLYYSADSEGRKIKL